MRLPKNFLAPISEYTNLPFRFLCQKYGVKATVVPLVNVTALSRRKEAINRVHLSDKEKFVGVQLFGSAPEEFKIAAKTLLDFFPFIKWFDVNCGCPMDNVMQVGAGAALLKHPKRVAMIVSSLNSIGVPVSVKMRLLDSQEKTIEFCKVVEEAGADFLIVHGRTPKQLYSGFANFGMIKKIFDEVTIPIVGNGDIQNAAEGARRVNSCYCTSFMIGRAAMKNPLCFQNKKPKNIKAQKKVFLNYASFSEKLDYLSLPDLRQKALFMFRGCENCSYIRLNVSQIKSIDVFIDFMKSL